MNPWTSKIEKEISESERWLAGFKTPTPSPRLIADIKRVTRDELRRRNAGRSRQPWAAWQGAVAGAAVLLLSVGVAWFSSRWQFGGTDRFVQNDVDLLLTQTIDPDLERLSTIEKELSALESMSSDKAWALNGTTFYDAMIEAVNDNSENQAGKAGAFIRSQTWSRQT